MGRIKSERRTIGGVKGDYETDIYNLDGSVANLTALGYGIAYTYNGAGRAITAKNNGDPFNYVTSASYAPFGGLTGMSMGAAPITVSNSYNSRLQPITLSSSTTAATIMSLSYDFHSATHADNGNVYQIVNNRDPNRTQNFLYDSLNRIQQAYTNGPNWGETFGPTATNPGVPPSLAGIDAWGNLTNRSAVNGKTNYEPLNCQADLSNHLTTCSLQYDVAGNVMNQAMVAYTYDAENRLIATSGMAYIYDGDGKRVEKCTGSTTTLGACATNPTGTLYWTGWSSDPQVETDLAGNVLENYIFFNGRRIARRDASGKTVHYYFSDHLGTHSLITAANGTMPPQEESDYYPYGAEIPVSGSDSNHYKFTGKERDSESGLDNFGARYFTSNMGRFMTPDWAARPTTVPYAVFGDPQSLNLYGYVRNDPISRIDPDGHYEVKPCGNYGKKCQKYNKAADNFEKERQKDLQSKDPRVRAAAAAFGDRDTKNGVHVGFEDLHDQHIKGSVEGKSNSGKGKLIDVEVTIDSGLKRGSLRETIAHEGSHVEDQINFLTSYDFGTGKYDSGANFTGQQTEFRAYQAGAGVSQEHGFGPNDTPQINDFITTHYEPNLLNNDYFPNNATFPQ